jgi:hypothetical protein
MVLNINIMFTYIKQKRQQGIESAKRASSRKTLFPNYILLPNPLCEYWGQAQLIMISNENAPLTYCIHYLPKKILIVFTGGRIDCKNFTCVLQPFEVILRAEISVLCS